MGGLVTLLWTEVRVKRFFFGVDAVLPVGFEGLLPARFMMEWAG